MIRWRCSSSTTTWAGGESALALIGFASHQVVVFGFWGMRWWFAGGGAGYGRECDEEGEQGEDWFHGASACWGIGGGWESGASESIGRSFSGSRLRMASGVDDGHISPWQVAGVTACPGEPLAG